MSSDARTEPELRTHLDEYGVELCTCIDLIDLGLAATGNAASDPVLIAGQCQSLLEVLRDRLDAVRHRISQDEAVLPVT